MGGRERESRDRKKEEVGGGGLSGYREEYREKVDH